MLREEDRKWAEETLAKVAHKLERVSDRSQDKVPYSTVDGVHDDRSGEQIGWWTNGFWGGMMWQMAALTGEEKYITYARRLEDKLDACLMDYEKLDHDNGFKWMPTAVADYRMTGDPKARNRGLLAASHLAGRYNVDGGFIRAWNNFKGEDHTGFAIIDCMMNLPLLYWASEELSDPRFAQIAVHHAEKAKEYFVRGDGSVNHIVDFDPKTGEAVRCLGGQGCGVGSSWTRGQSWGLYGFALSYRHTGDTSCLEASERIANYFLSNIPESGLIPVDFRQPEDVTYQDDTAAAIAACGLIELAKVLEGRQSTVYLDAALKLLKALAEKSCCFDEEQDHFLMRCTAAYHDPIHEFSIIYGDYYFLEALMKLTDRELFIW